MENLKTNTHEEIFTELESVLNFNALKNAPISLINEDIKAKKYLSKLLALTPADPHKIHRMLSGILLSEALVTEINEAIQKIKLQ